MALWKPRPSGLIRQLVARIFMYKPVNTRGNFHTLFVPTSMTIILVLFLLNPRVLSGTLASPRRLASDRSTISGWLVAWSAGVQQQSWIRGVTTSVRAQASVSTLATRSSREWPLLISRLQPRMCRTLPLCLGRHPLPWKLRDAPRSCSRRLVEQTSPPHFGVAAAGARAPLENL